MRTSNNALRTALGLLFFWGLMAFAPALQYAGKEEVAGKTPAWLQGKAFEWAVALPHENGLALPDVQASADGVQAERSFLVYDRKGVLSHAVADVVYEVEVSVSEGAYAYSFRNFRVYPHRRDRYGRYSRASSRGYDPEALPKSLKALVAVSIAQQVERYEAGLKQAMQ
jgi:hypothetical protein